MAMGDKLQVISRDGGRIERARPIDVPVTVLRRHFAFAVPVKSLGISVLRLGTWYSGLRLRRRLGCGLGTCVRACECGTDTA